jgi:hypothetical protein
MGHGPWAVGQQGVNTHQMVGDISRLGRTKRDPQPLACSMHPPRRHPQPPPLSSTLNPEFRQHRRTSALRHFDTASIGG